jgi:hypothetical protein
MFVFATETCAVCPLRAQCTRGQGKRTVQVHPQEALFQEARELQASPAFAEARRRHQAWSTASHAWCSWVFARRAMLDEPRLCSRCVSWRPWPTYAPRRDLQRVIGQQFGSFRSAVLHVGDPSHSPPRSPRPAIPPVLTVTRPQLPPSRPDF